MWSDAKQFWGKTPRRSLLLMLGCALVVALPAINTYLFRNSLWFVPPGIHSKSDFVTLGAYSAEGRFDSASVSDMRALDGLGFKNRYTLYGKGKGDVDLGGRIRQDLNIAYVSDEFFNVLEVPLALGWPASAERSGAVLDYEFWRSEFGADRAVIGKNLLIAGASVPIIGVSSEQFHGLGDRRPALWLPVRMRARLLQIRVQGGSGADLAAIKATMAEELPMYNAVVALKDTAERDRLIDWKVRTSEAVNLNASSTTKVTVAVNRRDFRPAVLDGINLAPAETAAIARYLWLLSGLSAILTILAIFNLGAYWSARTAERDQEIRLRHALGARLSDLLRLFASEAIPFLVVTVLCAIPIAWLQMKVLQHLDPFREFLQNRLVHLSVHDFVPSLLVVLIIGGVALLAPTLNVFRGSLRNHGLGLTAQANRRRLAMVAIQWLLVAGVAGLAGASVLSGFRMKNAGWGGEGDPLLLRLPLPEKRQGLLDALYVDVRSRSAATVDVEPLGILSRKYDAFVPGLNAGGRRLALYENEWSPGAVTALAVPLRAGRVYEAHSLGEAMVSESYARALGVSPETLLNHPLVRISTDGKELPTRMIVGVLADVHYNDLRTSPEMVVYVPPEAGNLGRNLLLPQAERGRIDAALLKLSHDRDITRALSRVTSIQQLRDDRARTETLLSFGTFAYALLALSLLMLGIVAEARMQLAQRGRELALIVSLGARLDRAVVYFLRDPLLVAFAAAMPVLLGAAASRERWLPHFPLLSQEDIWSVGGAAMVTVGAFGLTLICLAALRLRALSLAELLRVER